MDHRRVRDLIVFDVVCAFALFIVLQRSHSVVLNWDEVNWVNAAKLGFLSNAVDRGSMAPSGLLAFIRAKARHETPSMPRDYDEAADPLLLRSLHPPFIAYSVVPFAWARDERILRLGQLAGAIFFLTVALALHGRISASASWPGRTVIALVTVWLAPMVFGSVNCHGWMATWSMASAGFCGLWLRGARTRDGVLASVTLACSLLTLHTGVVVWGGVLVATLLSLLTGANPRAAWKPLLTTTLLALLVMLTAWPGAVVKLSLLRIFAQYFYLLSLGKEWADSRHLYGANALRLLPLVVAMPLTLWWLAWCRRQFWRLWLPAVLVGSLYAIPVVPNLLVPSYLVPALAPMVPLIGWWVDEFFRGTLRWAGTIAFGTLAAVSWLSLPPRSSDSVYRQDLSWLSSTLQGRETLADGAHIVRHYLGPTFDIRPISVDYEATALLMRERGIYRELTARDTAGKIVLVEARRVGFPERARDVAAVAACRRIQRPTVVLFDCAAGCKHRPDAETGNASSAEVPNRH